MRHTSIQCGVAFEVAHSGGITIPFQSLRRTHSYSHTIVPIFHIPLGTRRSPLYMHMLSAAAAKRHHGLGSSLVVFQIIYCNVILAQWWSFSLLAYEHISRIHKRNMPICCVLGRVPIKCDTHMYVLYVDAYSS